MPGDKSISQRVAMLASLADGTSKVTGYLNGEDARSTLSAMQQMGAKAEFRDDALYITGVAGKLQQPNEPLNMGNSGTGTRLLAGLVAGLTTGDYPLIGRSVNDFFAEPYRTHMLPDYAALKESALEAGSVGTGLSGSGPSVFSLCRGEEMASAVGEVMLAHFTDRGIDSRIYVSRISQAGCKII